MCCQRSFIILIACFISTSSFGQKSLPFTSGEIDSLLFHYKPLYKSDSIKFTQSGLAMHYNIFYFDGNCALCIGKLKTIENILSSITNRNIRSLFIVDTSDTISFNFHRDKINLSTPVLWDKQRRFGSKPINFTNDIFLLVDRNGRVLLKGDIVNDKKLKSRYLEMAKSLPTSFMYHDFNR
jgi:hypothetical protein